MACGATSSMCAPCTDAASSPTRPEHTPRGGEANGGRGGEGGTKGGREGGERGKKGAEDGGKEGEKDRDKEEGKGEGEGKREAWLELSCGREVGAGAEVCINYGQKSNLSLGLYYGFALPHNAADRLQIAIPRGGVREGGDSVEERERAGVWLGRDGVSGRLLDAAREEVERESVQRREGGREPRRERAEGGGAAVGE
eukprot:39773-Rhodomonas_salina.2